MTKRTFLTVSLLAPILAGCGHKDTLVGKWQGTSTQQGGAMNATFEFTPDNKETIQVQSSMGQATLAMAVSGTYAVSGTSLTQTLTTMTMNGRTFPVPAHPPTPQPFTLDGDHLTLTNPGSQQSITLTRVKG